MPPRVPAFAPTVEDETQVIAPPTVPEVEEEPERISTVAVPTVVPPIVDDVERAINLAPEPDKLRSVYDTAIALSEGLGVPVWQAFSQAQALQESPNETHRTIAQDAGLAWRRSSMEVDIDILWDKMRNSGDEGD